MRRPMTAKRAGLSALMLMALGAPAAAHPHAWVDMKTQIIFNDQGLIAGLSLFWVFDEAYTQVAIEGLDAEKDGAFSEAELAPLTKVNMQSIADYHYFTAMERDGERQLFGPVDAANAKQLYANNRLALHFTVPLATPIDPRKGKFTAQVYDPDYYIAFAYVEGDPIMMKGTPPPGCQPKLLPLPTGEELEQTRDFLATKGKDWKPEPAQEFGAMFAQSLAVECSS
jgi:ABC-type uncharacterized transport system substrate-binding protein